MTVVDPILPHVHNRLSQCDQTYWMYSFAYVLSTSDQLCIIRMIAENENERINTS